MGGAAVMVVDDDADVREMLAQVLELEGYDVLTAADGERALALLTTTPPPLAILLDLRMPGMNGWQFRAAQLRDPRLCAIPVIVVSADRTSTTPDLAGLGVLRVYRKPIDLEALLGDLEWLRRRSLRDGLDDDRAIQ